MSTPADASSKYLLAALFFPVQSCRFAAPASDAEEGEFQWGWDWQWVDHEHFEVAVIVKIGATAARPYDLEVAVTGRFKPVGDYPPVTVPDFAHHNGPAILFPYVRQAIDDLTSRAHTSRLLLPPINVQLMMADVDPAAARGASQARPAPSSP